jgi:Holliday junction resolvase
MANSKQKGNKGEREVAKWWEAWTGMEFARIPSSGGLRWHSTHNTVGDIMCTHEIHSRRFQFTIECKNYKDINFEHLILGNKKVKILEFWQQTQDDAVRGDKVPILFMRYNGMPKGVYFVIVSTNLFTLLASFILEIKEHTYFITPNQDFVIFNSNMLVGTDYKQIHKYLKKERKNGQKF